MEFTFDIGNLESEIKDKAPKEIRELVKKSMEGVAIEWESEAKRIIQDGALDTGEFVNSVHFEMFEEGDDIGFIGSDGVDYGVYWEYGTIKHWVPFYRYGNLNEPVLAEWGHRVLGLSEEEMLKMGGMEVEIPELKPFMKAMLKAQSGASEIFTETFDEVSI
jgi:hypothetical protein